MIDLKVTDPYKSAKNAINFLTDAKLWMVAFADDDRLKNLVIEWIQKDQLIEKGVDGNGQVIGFYSLATSFINPEKSFNTHYTLRDTGQFFRSMFVNVLVSSIDIVANTAKMEGQEWWREEILSLTEENMDRLRQEYLGIADKYARTVLSIGI